MKEHLEQLPIPLLEWYRENARSLPWREDPTPYHVWLSEIMLQQTRVAAVLGYYTRLLEYCPTVADLAALPEERLLKLWEGLGYYDRARSLHRTAKIITQEYGGQFPADYAALRALPGVGDYTAGAICSIVFGMPTPAVDGNVLRVVARIAGDEGDIATTPMKKKVTAALGEVIPTKAAGDFNQALMELGAVICLPKAAPLCEKCPASSFCVACREGLTGKLPVKAPPKARRVEERDVFLIFFGGRVALRRRPPRGLLAGLWEFPNELSPAPSPVQGLERGRKTAKHIFTHVEWHMRARLIFPLNDALPEGWVWADKGELARKYAIPNAFASFTQAVEENLAITGGQ